VKFFRDLDRKEVRKTAMSVKAAASSLMTGALNHVPLP